MDDPVSPLLLRKHQVCYRLNIHHTVDQSTGRLLTRNVQKSWNSSDSHHAPELSKEPSDGTKRMTIGTEEPPFLNLATESNRGKHCYCGRPDARSGDTNQSPQRSIVRYVGNAPLVSWRLVKGQSQSERNGQAMWCTILCGSIRSGKLILHPVLQILQGFISIVSRITRSVGSLSGSSKGGSKRVANV